MSKDKDTIYYQSLMKQNNATAVGWIEERGAVVGYHVELPELGGFWEVKEVWQPGMKWSDLSAKNEMNRHHREGSDI